jgi:spore maturation protein SpmB
MNMAANALGLGNAATPMGIKAMQELDTLSTEKGTATNAMCLFLAINTSSVTLLPLGVITVRAAADAASPASILIPSLIATICSTTVAIVAAKMLAGKDTATISPSVFHETIHDNEESNHHAGKGNPSSRARIFIGLILLVLLGAIPYRVAQFPVSFSVDTLNTVSDWLIPLLICALLAYGYLRGVKVYESATEGAKEGFTTAVRIIPFMVAIFVAIGMFRASGAMDILIRILSPMTELIGMPAEALSMALMRPLSGSGAFGLMSEIVQNDPDSFLSFLVSTMQGSTETTFYVLAVYFGSVGIKRTRHALPAALCADAAGIVASVAVCNFFF